MPSRTVRRSARLVQASASAMLGAIALAGCQTYEPAPLALDDHRARFAARLDDTESITAFAERLRASNDELDPAAATVFDPTDGISPAEGEVLALFHNPDLRLARLEAGVALAEFETAGLWQDPVFGFDGAEIISPTSPFEFGLGLSLTIPISGRLEVAKERAGAAYETELRRVVDAEWTMRARVRRAWARRAAAIERVGLLRDVVAGIERITAITDRLETAGEVSRVEGRLFRVELADRRAQLVEAEGRVVEADVALLGLLGLPPDATVELDATFPTVGQTFVDDEAERLITANTTLAVRRAAYRVAEESLRLEVRKQFPDITIGAGYGSEDRDDRLLLGFSMPIPSINANRAGIAEARARREVARVAAETEYERIVQQLAGAHALLATIDARRENYERVIVPMVAEQADELERIAALGEVDSFLLLETITRQLDTKDRLLDLRVAEFDAAIEITRLLGPDAPRDPAPVRANDADVESTPDQLRRKETLDASI